MSDLPEGARVLGRTDIDAIARYTEYLHVPEWGGWVRIQELSGADRDAYEASIVGTTRNRKGTMELDLSNARARMVTRALIDEHGQRLYKDNEAYQLGQRGAAGLNRVYDRVREISGITTDDEKELEDLAGNSKAEANGISGSV
jgi:hypothetical protein